PIPPPPPPEWGTMPESLECSAPANGLDIGKDVAVLLRPFLNVVVRDDKGRPVRAALEWVSSDPHAASITSSGELFAKEKGTCEICIRVKGTGIQSNPLPVRVWN